MAVRVQLNHAGVRELLRSPEMLAECKRHADAIAARAGEGFEVRAEVGRNRVRATVETVTTEARVRQATEHTLERALGGA